MPEIVVDFSGVGAALVQAIIDHASELGTALWGGFSAWLYGGMRALFFGMLNATLLVIPNTLTNRFGPVIALMPNPTLFAGSAAALSMALLGLKVILQRIPAQTAVVEGVIGRLVLYGATLGILPWLIDRAITIEQQLIRGISITALEAIVPAPAAMQAWDIIQVVGWIALIVLGIRLWFKLASNVVHLAVAVVWSPVAMVAGFFPQTDSIARMWFWEFFGRLAGAALATIAVGLGLAIAVMYPGLLTIAGAGGAFMAAADLVDWLARTPGQRMGGALGAVSDAVQAGAAIARGAGSGGTSALASIPRNQVTTRAEMFGFD